MFLWNTTSVINAPILRHIPQILPNIPMEEQIHIVNGRIVHQPLQLDALIYIRATSASTSVQSMEIMLPSANLTSTQAVSILNAHEITFFSITVPS